MVVQLDEELWFPDPRKGDDDGLFAIGGDLSVERLLLAYNHGIFPWFAFRKEDYKGWPDDFFSEEGKPMIQWWCPMKRFVIFPDEIHISHSMRQLIRSQKYYVTFNEAFDQVIQHCSELRIKECGAWLGPDIIEAYTNLNEMKAAVSLEVWDEHDNLVGGLYGVAMGNGFYGESMFSLVPSASKLALITLAQALSVSDRQMLIDCQFETPHLKSMGGRYISYDEYMDIISPQNEEEV